MNSGNLIVIIDVNRSDHRSILKGKNELHRGIQQSARRHRFTLQANRVIAPNLTQGAQRGDGFWATSGYA